MMLPQQYNSSESPCSVSVNDTSVVQLPPANSSSHYNSDAVIAGSSEDAPTTTSQNTPAWSGTKRVSAGPRPLMLGTVRIVTTSPGRSASRPSSSSSLPSARYTRSIPQARWSSYTTPLSSFTTLSVSDEVASLKARLAESEARAEDLVREKLEAVDAACQVFTNLRSLRDQKVKRAKERDEVMKKLRALDEEKATLVVLPPSEGVWFGGSDRQQQVEKLESQSLSLTSFFDLDAFEPQRTQRSEGNGAKKVTTGSLDEAPRIPEIRVTPPEPSEADSEPEVNSTPLVDGCNGYLSPPEIRRRSHVPTNATDDHSQCVPQMVQQAAPPNPPSSASLRRHFLKWPRIPSNPPSSASLRRQHLKWPPIRPNSLPELVSGPTRWLSGAPKIETSQLSLVDLGSQVVGIDPLSGSVARQVIHDRGKELLSLEEALKETCPSINLATAGELEARMIRVSIDADRSRGTASATTREEPQIHIFPESFFDPPSEIGGDRRGFFSSLGRLVTPWRRSTKSDRKFATVGDHATLESPSKAGPFGIFTRFSSSRGTAPEVAGDPQPRRKLRLRKLLTKGRCLISAIE